MSKLPALIELHCDYNELESLDVSGHKQLRYLYCYSNKLVSLNVYDCPEIAELWCYYNDDLEELDISTCEFLKQAYANGDSYEEKGSWNYVIDYPNYPSQDPEYYWLSVELELDKNKKIFTDHEHKKEIISPFVAPGCTTTGLTESSKCSVCGEILQEQKEIEALGHDYGEWEETTPATCLEGGEEKQVCSRNEEHFETRKTNALGHKKVTDDAVAATCTTSGLTDGSHCERCGTVFTEQKEIPALGHNWGDWTVVKPATVDSEGQEQRVCKNDSKHIEKRKIDKKENVRYMLTHKMV